MAEYYPLLAKAVASLPNSTPETRRAIYERARKALLGQLRAVQPPVPEDDISKENQSLDSAIAKLESEFEAAAQITVKQQVSAKEDVPAAPPPGPLAETPASPAPPVNAPSIRPPAAETLAQSATPTQSAPSPGPVPRPRLTPSPISQAGPLQGAEGAGANAETKDLPLAAPNALSTPPTDMAAKPPIKMRPEQQRPVAPQVNGPKQGPKGLWIVLSVIGLIVAGVAFAAWKLRDRPEDLAKIKFIPAQQQTEANGKIVERAGDNATAKNTGAAATTAATQTPPDAVTNVPVTYRAALLVQAPEEKTKVKTYFGTVIWRLDNVSNGPGEPVGTAIHANVDIPEDKFQASMTLRKNLDASLSASHTMTIVFTLQPSTPTGAIKQIGVPQMRKEDSATGESLIGLPVPIMENSFLIGLAKGGPESTNIDLLKTRQWIDVPMLLSDGRIAKLTFEKGVAGARAMEDAIASWQAP
jgi:hypothetical protein